MYSEMVSSSKKSANLRLKSGRNLCTSPGPGRGLKKQQRDAGCACNYNARQAEAGGLFQVQGQSGDTVRPYSKALSKKNNNQPLKPNPQKTTELPVWVAVVGRENKLLPAYVQTNLTKFISPRIYFLYAINMQWQKGRRSLLGSSR